MHPEAGGNQKHLGAEGNLVRFGAERIQVQPVVEGTWAQTVRLVEMDRGDG